MKAISESAFIGLPIPLLYSFLSGASMVPSRSATRPTIADVALRAGVSIATVSRVINGTAEVVEETAQRVRSAVTELNYRPSAAARGLASKQTGMIGLLTGDLAVPFFNPILRGIDAVSTEVGFGLLINCTYGQPGAKKGFDRHLGPHNTDGLLVFAGTLDDEELFYLHQMDFPVVLLHQTAPHGLRFPSITFENKAGTRKLIDHLIENHAYRRIAFLRGPETHEDSYWREMGYRESLIAHGIPYDENLVATGEFSQPTAFRAVTDWLAKGTEIDAIFGGDDEGAIGAITALQQAGKRVPEDIAVVGFDDVHLANYPLPPITTVRAPVEQAGIAAANQLIKLIRKERADMLVLLPTELVLRRSCGCHSFSEGGVLT
jgi:LacI family transcriptional regulator